MKLRRADAANPQSNRLRLPPDGGQSSRVGGKRGQERGGGKTRPLTVHRENLSAAALVSYRYVLCTVPGSWYEVFGVPLAVTWVPIG